MIKKRRYLDFEILKAEKEGFKVFREGIGRISFAPQSFLFRSISACQKAFPTAEVAFRSGGSVGNGTREWCVVYRPRNEAPGRANGLFGENGVVSENFMKENSYSAKRAAAVSSGCADDERGR